ncbi:MAG: carboxypeptidase regulatory-like domain-containing protein [Elusimicrobiota bacterium]
MLAVKRLFAVGVMVLPLFLSPVPVSAELPLEGRVFAVNPGHGMLWETALTPDAFTTERGASFGGIEDYSNPMHTWHIMNYILESGGATAYQVREYYNYNNSSVKYGLSHPYAGAENQPLFRMTAPYWMKKDPLGLLIPETVHRTTYYYTNPTGAGAANEKNRSNRSRPFFANWLMKDKLGRCDAMITVHTNAASGTARGTLMLIDGDNNSDDAEDYDGTDMAEHTAIYSKAKTLSTTVLNKVVSQLQSYVDPTWSKNGSSGFLYRTFSYAENRYTKTPYAMLEAGFHDNAIDGPQMITDRWNMIFGQSVYKALCDYFKATDYNLPSQITDLVAAPGFAAGQVRLVWTAPGEDGTLGSASAYIVKYSASAITSTTTFNAATTYTQTWIPKKRRSREEYILTGFTPGNTYHFSVRSKNFTNDTSRVSNPVSAVVSNSTGVAVGKISGTVKGLMTDEGIAATVTRDPDGSSMLASSGGVFAFNDLFAGSYSITAAAAGYTSSTTVCAVVAGGTTTVVISLSGGTYGMITGKVTDSVLSVELSGVKVTDVTGGGIAYTDNDGVYKLVKLSAGAHQISFQYSNYATKSKLVVVTAGQVTTSDETLVSTGGSTYGVITGTIKNSQNSQLISNAVCVLSPESLQKLTNGEGVYRFENVVMGSHTVTVSYGGFITKAVSTNLAPGATATLNINLVPDGSGGSETKIYGKVLLSGTTTAIYDADIILYLDSVQVGSALKSGSDGSYEFGDLSPGSYVLAVSKNGYESARVDITLVANEAKVVNASLTKSEVSELSGVVKDKSTQQPIAGVAVKLTKSLIEKTAVTGSDGVFSFTSLNFTSCKLSFSKVGYDYKEMNVTLVLGMPKNVAVELTQKGNLEEVKVKAVYIPVSSDGTENLLPMKFNLSSGNELAAVKIYDIKGRMVKNVEDIQTNGAEVTATWNGTDSAGRKVASGVYFYQIESGGKVRSGRVLVAK